MVSLDAIDVLSIIGNIIPYIKRRLEFLLEQARRHNKRPKRQKPNYHDACLQKKMSLSRASKKSIDLVFFWRQNPNLTAVLFSGGLQIPELLAISHFFGLFSSANHR